MSRGSVSRWLANSSGLWWLLLVGLVTVALCLPFMQTVTGLGDEGVYLHGAERIVRGDRLYTDFFEFLPPGTFVGVAAWFGIAGTSLASARLLAIVVIVGITCFIFLTCRQASRHAPASAIVAIAWVVMSQGVATQISHHWFTTLFSIVALWSSLAMFAHPSRWLPGPLIAGIATGAAAMATPTRGALAMLAAATAFLDLRRYRIEFGIFVLGGALVPISFVAYLIWHESLIDAFNDVIRFTASRYSSIQGVPFGNEADAQNLPLKYLFPLAALLVFFECVRNWRSCRDDPVFRLCVAFGIAGFIGCFPRPDIAHIAFAVPLVLPLLACCASRLMQAWPPKYRYATALLVIGVCIPSARAFSWITQNALRAEVVSMPRGGVSIRERGVNAIVSRIAATPTEDKYFFYPYIPMLPFLTARQHVSHYDIFVPGYNSRSQYREACVSAVQHAKWVVIDRNWSNPDFMKKVFPAIQNINPEERVRFEQALESAFELVVLEQPFELRRRIPTIDETVCAGIAD